MKGKFEQKPKRKKNKFLRFLRRASKDKRYRAVFTVLMLIAAGFTGKIWQARNDKTYYTTLLEQQEAQYNADLATQKEEYEAAMDHLRELYENPTQEEIMAEEAKWIAKVLYGVCPRHATNSQRTVVWCILNRRDSGDFPNTVAEVCAQRAQWISFSEENPVLTNLYNVAMEELEKYYAGNRPCDASYVYIDWSNKVIYLKDDFNSIKSTRYWTYE